MKNIDDLIARLESYENYDGFNDDLVTALRAQRDEIARLWDSDSKLADRAERAEAERDAANKLNGELVASNCGLRIELDAAIKRAEIAEGEVDLYADQVDALVLPVPFGAEHGRAWHEAVQESIDAAMRDAERYRWLRQCTGKEWDDMQNLRMASGQKNLDSAIDAAIDAAMKGKP